MKFQKEGISTAAIAGIVVVVVVVVAVGGYVALSPGQMPPTATITSTTTTSTVSTSTVPGGPVTASVVLNGAGSTFIQPVLTAMISQYQMTNPAVSINYQGIGSGGGISALEGKTVDFAASDAPLAAADQAKAPGALTIPTTIGAVTVAYNLPGIKSNLHLTGKTVADIFAGNVTMWNDPEIASQNSNVTLPAKSILVVHRSDSSGTTFTFTGYLSQVSTAWNKSIGQAKSVAWPVGLGANGNQGVAGVVQGTTFTVGYVELAYALSNSMTVASIQNSAGSWILPTLASSAAAAAAMTVLPAGAADWSKINLLNQPGTTTYPIVTYSYVIVYKELSTGSGMTQSKAAALVKFLWWSVHDGQGQAQALSYVPLPASVVTLNAATISSITFNGQTLPTT